MLYIISSYKRLLYLSYISFIEIILLFSLIGCSNVKDFQDNLIFKQQQNIAAKQGNEYLRLADASVLPEEKNKYILYGVEALIQANDIGSAKHALTKIDPSHLSEPQYVIWKVLLAQINLVDNNLPTAKRLLASVSGYQNLTAEIYKTLYQTKIRMFQQNGEPLEAIQEQIHLEKFLTTNQDIINNQRSIWAQLQQLSPGFLLTINHDNFSYIMQGWLKIASIIRKYDYDPKTLSTEISEWQQDFPNHPADKILSLDYYKIYQHNYPEQELANKDFQNIHKIALLLPLSGKYAASGIAVKHGFLAGSYNKTYGSKPEILIFDTNQEPLYKLHKQLQEQPVDLIVGPLLKEELEKFTSLKVTIPTILLNNINRNTSKLLYQFALPPETEGHAIIARARNNKYRNALLIVEDNKSNQRIANTITTNWNLLENNIVAHIKFTRTADINELLKAYLGIKASKERATDLAKLGVKFNFDPRRRQDIDCIFLLASAANARQIKPLLNFYYAGKIPVYASSSVYTGINNPRLDRDLDGVEFCDIPWMIDPAITDSNIYQRIKTLWQNSFSKNPRLYALGIDAYKLATQMQLLHYAPEIGISGVTGILTINSDNVITRKLMWGVFQNGIPVILNQKN